VNDRDKTREQLIEELESLRKRLTEAEDSERQGGQNYVSTGKKLAFLRKIVDTIPNPIFVKDKEGRYVFCNTAFETYTGLKKEEIVGKTDYDVSPKRIADPYHEMDNILLESGGAQDYEIYFQNPDGNNQATLFNKACYTHTDGTVVGLVGVITDVTDRKAVEEEKKELIRELSRALAEIKTLSGLLPICSYCKKVRDDQGYWSRIEKYIQENSEATFSHGICPDCMKRRYPEQYEKLKGNT
jgi:PAS domain S-box-containing protein